MNTVSALLAAAVGLSSHRSLGRKLLPVLSVIFVCALSPGKAQQSPRIGFVYPAGGQQGQTFTVFVGGQFLNNASAAYFSGSGIAAKVIDYERPLTQKEINDLRERAEALQAKRAAARSDPSKPPFTAADEKMAAEIRELLATRGNRQATPAVAETVTMEITLAPNAVAGEREVRLKTPNGLSNPLVFFVGQLPERTEPVTKATANRGQRPRAADPHAARASAGTTADVTLPTVMNGQILPGEVDRYHFTARKGQRLVFAVSARALIPYLADAVPGWFQATLTLFDSKGHELAYNDDFRFNPDPVLACEIPADGSYSLEIKDAIYRGREDFVYRIAGGELPFVTSVFPLGGRVGEKIQVALTGWNLSVDHLMLDMSDRKPGTFLLFSRNGEFLSNPVRFALEPFPDVLAAEPNDTPAAAQRLTLPAIVNGRIERNGDEDHFRFEGKAGDIIVAEVFARRFGSPLDSVLLLTDEKGARIASNDDSDDPSAGLLTHHADSRIMATLPADGAYFLRLADTQRHGGADYGYRLRVSAPQPDFELRVVPSTINVRAGATVPITIYALRRDGFTGEIALGLKDPPAGFRLSGARIPADAQKVQLTITAPPGPNSNPFSLTFGGIATIGGKSVAHIAMPADDMMQAFAYRHLVPAREMKVIVAGRGSSLRLATQGPLQIRAGSRARIRVDSSAARFPGKIRLELHDGPPGLAVEECTTKGDFIEVVVACISAEAKAGLRGNLIFEAFGERNAGKTGKAQTQRSPLGVVPAVPFEIVTALASGT